jgi:hypothetical protein
VINASSGWFSIFFKTAPSNLNSGRNDKSQALMNFDSSGIGTIGFSSFCEQEKKKEEIAYYLTTRIC